MNEYRLTRNMCYAPGTPNEAKQGHYLKAETAGAAYLEMGRRYPEDVNAWGGMEDGPNKIKEPFSLELWKRDVGSAEPKPTDDRKLHLMGNCEEHLANVRAKAREMDIEDKLEEGLEYLRTFGAGSEAQGFRTELWPDAPGDSKMNFVANVRFPSGGGMTIGMILHEGDREWSFHS